MGGLSTVFNRRAMVNKYNQQAINFLERETLLFSSMLARTKTSSACVQALLACFPSLMSI
jgi:hypothetical protein